MELFALMCWRLVRLHQEIRQARDTNTFSAKVCVIVFVGAFLLLGAVLGSFLYVINGPRRGMGVALLAVLVGYVALFTAYILGSRRAYRKTMAKRGVRSPI